MYIAQMHKLFTSALLEISSTQESYVLLRRGKHNLPVCSKGRQMLQGGTAVPHSLNEISPL